MGIAGLVNILIAHVILVFEGGVMDGNYRKIKEKVKEIKDIQRRRIEKQESYAKIGDVLALTVSEAEYLISMIEARGWLLREKEDDHRDK